MMLLICVFNIFDLVVVVRVEVLSLVPSNPNSNSFSEGREGEAVGGGGGGGGVVVFDDTFPLK